MLVWMEISSAHVSPLQYADNFDIMLYPLILNPLNNTSRLLFRGHKCKRLRNLHESIRMWRVDSPEQQFLFEKECLK